MKRIIVAALFATGLTFGIARAGVPDGADLPALVAGADLIVVGHAIGTHADATGESFVVAVDRAVTGGGSSRVAVRLDLIDADQSGVTEGQYGIFFLRRGPKGTYGAVDPDHPALAAVPGVPVIGADPLSRVAGELAASLGAATGDRADDQETAEALSSIPYGAIAKALASMTNSTRPSIRLWAADVLIANAPDDQSDAVASLLASVAPALMVPDPALSFTTAMVSHTIAAHVRSARATPVLKALLRSSDPSVRDAASIALDNIAD